MQDEMKALQEILSGFDKSAEKFTEYDVVSAIERYIRTKGDSWQIPTEFSWEKMAFEFRANRSDDANEWGTYYSPMVSGTTNDGEYFEYPSIKEMTPDTFAYWSNRTSLASHPVLKARYADLVWEFSKLVTEARSDVRMAHIAIDSRLEIAQSDLHSHRTDVIDHLKRALLLSISLNDSARICNTRDAIIAFEERIAEDEKAGLWGFSYDLLVGNRKVSLSKDLEDKIIRDLEGRLNRLTRYNDELSLTSHRWKAVRAVSRLTCYYKKRGKADEVKRVILKYYEGFKHLVDSEASLIASDWLQEVFSTFKQFGFNEEAEAIAPILREVWNKGSKEMSPHSFEMEVSREELDEFVNSLLSGGQGPASIRIALHFIPKRDEVENQVKTLAKDHPLSFLFTRQLLDHEGRPVASVRPIEADLDGNVVHQISQNMVYSSFFLRKALAAFIDRYEVSALDFLSHIYTSPIFVEDKKGIVEKGIDAYLQGDALTSVHLLIPQIEASIRKLAELLGIAIIKRGRNGAMQLKLLDELLRERQMEETLGRDASLYFRILLTDQRGWNLRNSVSHGLLPHEQFEQGMADRVLHVLLCLGLIREKPAEANA